MKLRPNQIVYTTLLTCCLFTPCRFSGQKSDAPRVTGPVVVLNREQASTVLPASVFFRGQSASIQARNSAGLRSPNGKLVLVAMVDTAGYSSSLQQTYQAYLLSEIPLSISGRALPPGAYGFGFVAGDKMIVMDIGGNELLSVATTRDEKLVRPTPLQIIADGQGAGRLYLGRSYVSISPSER